MSAFKPNLFILGAAKSGTTTLHNYLARLPDVCMSNPKEPFFFEAEYERGLDFYRQTYFSHWKDEAIIGESRHRNLILPYVPQRIFTVNPNAKLIVIARNPIDRAYSHWFHSFSRADEQLSFADSVKQDIDRINNGLICSTEDEIRKHASMLGKRHRNGEIGLGLYRTYIDTGYYQEQINRYLNYFRSEQLKVVIFEEMVKDPKSTMEGVIQFLGLDASRNYYEGEIWKNKKKNELLWKNRNPLMKHVSRWLPKSFKNKIKQVVVKRIEKSQEIQMDAKTRELLEHHYAPHVEQLQNFLGRPIEAWSH